VIFNNLFIHAKPDPFFDLRVLVAIGLVINHGVALVEVAKRLGVSTATVTKIIKRAKQ
jgi:transposase